MKLCLDCGNTRIKWGLHDGLTWYDLGAVPTAEPARLAAALPAGIRPTTVIACNVAGPAVAAAIDAQFDLPIRWNTAQAEQGGVYNGYAEAARLGADRWAALLGARALHKGPCLVVSAGTATTIDMLTGDGRFLGGLILPGLDLMQRSLAGNTAQLSLADGHYVEQPTMTADAITSGTLQATLGAIERQYRILQEQADIGGTVLCLLTGGAASRLAPCLALPYRAEPQLILEGLARLAP